jgi:hypothetical protein
MSDDFTAEESAGGVSPVRKKISALVLCVLSIVLIIEVRAGLGHMLSGKMLREKSPEGVFEKVLLEEFEPMLSLAPTRTTVRENDDQIDYKYSWFSLLRPLLKRPEAAFYVVASNSTPSYVRLYSTEALTEAQLAAAAARASESVDASEDNEVDGGGFGGGGGGFGGGDGFGGGGPGGGGPPPQDPTVTLLDKDGNGELTEDELESASAALFAADKNGDGTLTQDELQPAGDGRTAGRQRPPLDTSDEDDAPSADEPEAAAEEKADDSPDDASEKTEQKPESGESPAPEKPTAE